ncbi:aminoglycoside phosphotransferase family protein [Bacillus sp. P14.5]|uniref:aminoglycoside phosphotransferase family protein n=1 Tax=Bacillus sp. P14.5 TaxID=1983400 RepID=UPI000DEAFF4E|nr:aminoglycoside phosphotransferase family protein [Bacillus sp. P14.5]
MNEQLVYEIEKIVGDIEEIMLLEEQGCTSEVRKLVTGKGAFILKSSFQPKYQEWLKSEAEVLKNNQLLPMPRYHGYFEEQGSHLLMSYEKGITLRQALEMAGSREEEMQLIQSFGRFLQELHEMIIPNHQENWLEVQLNRAEQYLKKGEADGSMELLEYLKKTKPSPVKQTLIHGDSTTDNVLVRNGKVFLFIDVAGMTVGDPRYDEALAIGRLRGREDYLKAFYKGYTRYKITDEEYHYFDEGLYEFF